MASTPTTPSAPVSAPSSAGSSSAPSTTPVTTSPASETPVTTPAATPAAIEIDSSPATPPAATEAVAAPSKEPLATEYPNTREGQEKFLNDRMQWDLDHPEVEADTTQDTKPAEDEVKTEESTVDADKTADAEDADKDKAPEIKAEDVTPEVVGEWMKTNPALEAALKASPEIKNAMYAMARQNARAKPLLELFPTEQSAKFANEQAGVMVDIRGALTEAADNPEMFPKAMEAFSNQFMVKDKEGKPVLDAGGNPQFYDDYNMLAEGFFTGAVDDMHSHFSELVKASPDDERAQLALSALEYVKELAEEYTGKTTEKFDDSKLTPEQKAWQQKQQAELDAERQKLGIQSKTQTAEQKKVAADNWDKGCKQQIGGLVGKTLGQWLGEQEKNNVFLPSYVTDAKDAQGRSIFATNLFDQFNAKVLAVPHIKDELKRLERVGRLNPTQENAAARVQYYGQLVADYMPTIMQKELDAVTVKEKADRAKRSGNADKKAAAASTEPSGGRASGIGGNRPKSDEEAMQQAYAVVDKQYPPGSISGGKRTEFALNEFNKMSLSALR